jgi:hypothetical protein
VSGQSGPDPGSDPDPGSEAHHYDRQFVREGIDRPGKSAFERHPLV